MEIKGVFEIILLGFGVSFIGFFVSIFFLVKTSFSTKGYFFLYLSIISVVLELVYKSLLYSGIIINYPGLFFPGRYFNLSIYPLLLLFVWSFTKNGFKLKTPYIVLLFVVLIFGVYPYINSLQISTDLKEEMIANFYNDSRPGPFNYWSNLKTFFKGTFIPLLFLLFIFRSFIMFKKTNLNIKNNRLVNLVLVTVIIYFFYSQFSNLIYKGLYLLIHYSMIEWPVDIIFLSLLCMLFCVLAMKVNTGSTFFPEQKYATSSFKITSYDDLITKVRKNIESEKLYLNGKLTLDEVAKSVNTNPKYLSQTINHSLELSFVDFINKYRVEESKKQLLKKGNSLLTFEAIGLKSGFNSKSSFFRAFKKHTNLTPKQFIENKMSVNS
jgi:AraC-like DNA-binding protein